MALLCSWSFTLVLLSTSVVASAIPEYSVAETDAEVDKKGYEVKTVLDGNKLGHTFYNIREDTNGDRTSVIGLDSTRSNILRVSLPLSQNSVIERISGSAEGKSGYRDGTTDEALFNHPKKITLDSDGNIYVADPRNGAVRMITRTGFVTTIAGGSNQTGHNDGESSEVTFSNDFDVTYLHSTCTLAIADRGNRMIREIQLPQFIGRCNNSTPDSPGSQIQGATLLMFFLGGIVGILAGVAGTILTISTRRLEQLQSSLCWAITEDPSWASSSISETIMKPPSTDKVKEISSTDKVKEISSTDKAKETSSTDKVKEISSTDKAKETSSTDKVKEISSTDKAKEISSTDKGKEQVKEPLKTRSSVIRNAVVEHLIWSPGFIIEILITLFEKFLYILLYSLSLFLRLLCSQPFRNLFHQVPSTTLHNPDNQTDLLGLQEQAYNQPSVSRSCSMSLIPALWGIGSTGSVFIRWPCFQVKNFQQAPPQGKDFLILDDLIDFSDPAKSEVLLVDSATGSAIAESTPANICNELKIDSMVEKCLAELTCPSTSRIHRLISD